MELRPAEENTMFTPLGMLVFDDVQATEDCCNGVFKSAGV